MNTRILLILIGVASLTAGCFLAKTADEYTGGKLPTAGTDRAGISNPVSGDGVGSSGDIHLSSGQQQTNDTGNRAGSDDKRNISDGNVASLNDLSEGDRVRVHSRSNPGNGYDFVYIGRNDKIEHRQLAQIIGWSVASSGIAFIAGMLVYRNNKKRLERTILTAIAAGETAEEAIRKYIK